MKKLFPRKAKQQDRPDGVRLLVCGSRNWTAKEKIFRAIQDAKPTELIAGGCRGADVLAEAIAKEQGIPVRVFPADWETHGKKAGPLRNQKMVDEKPDLCLAFMRPESVGSWDTVAKCKKAGIPVQIIFEND